MLFDALLPFFKNPVLQMVPWEEDDWRGIFFHLRSTFSLYRGLKNLEKAFQTESGEDTVQTSSGPDKIEIKPCVFFLALMDSFEGPWRSGQNHQ